MSLAFKAPSVLEQKYATKAELHYGFRVSEPDLKLVDRPRGA